MMKTNRVVPEEVLRELARCADENGLLPTLDAVFGSCVKISVPYGQRAMDTRVEELSFSVRAGNALKGAGVHTVGEIVALIESGELGRIRNLGKKTENEIKTRVMMFGYERMTDAEKRSFFYEILNEQTED